MNVSTVDTALVVQIGAPSISIGIGSSSGSSAYATEEDGNVVLYGVTATDENEDGNVYVSGLGLLYDDDGNIRVAQAASNSVSVSVDSPSVSAAVGAAEVEVSIGLPVVTEYSGGETYSGSYAVTPTTETQTLSTAGCVLTKNITVNPIPSNYGLITWNGSVLTVS